jgi:ketosteroid isomerase-like protein
MPVHRQTGQIMIRILPLALAALAVAGGARAASVAASVAAQITAAEASCNKAYAANDLKTYFDCYAPDLTGLFPDGRTTLEAYRTDWSKMIQDGGHVDKFNYWNMIIQVSPGGDAAVASYQADVRVTAAGGKPGDTGKFYETDVWFRRAGVWKIVETHYSKADAGK